MLLHHLRQPSLFRCLSSSLQLITVERTSRTYEQSFTRSWWRRAFHIHFAALSPLAEEDLVLSSDQRQEGKSAEKCIVAAASTLECRRRRAACCGTRHRAGHHQYPHPHTRRAPSPGWSFICFSASGFLWRPSIRSAPRFYFPVVSCLSLSKLSAATCFCSRAITAAHASGPTEASSQAASVSTVPNGSK